MLLLSYSLSPFLLALQSYSLGYFTVSLCLLTFLLCLLSLFPSFWISPHLSFLSLEFLISVIGFGSLISIWLSFYSFFV